MYRLTRMMSSLPAAAISTMNFSKASDSITHPLPSVFFSPVTHPSPAFQLCLACYSPPPAFPFLLTCYSPPPAFLFILTCPSPFTCLPITYFSPAALMRPDSCWHRTKATAIPRMRMLRAALNEDYVL